MKIHIATIIKDFWSYLGIQQGVIERLVHIAIALLIVLQIIDSNFISVNAEFSNFGEWFHFIIGFFIASLFLIFAIILLVKRGFHYFILIFLRILSA